MDTENFQEIKKRIKNKRVKSINDFPLYADRTVTIEDIEEIETFADHAVIYHGNQRSYRVPYIVALKGRIAESDDNIFLSLTRQGANGCTENEYGEPERNIFRHKACVCNITLIYNLLNPSNKGI